MNRAVNLIQAQRACVMQPRVRRTLGIEPPHVFISPNPNGVPSGSRMPTPRVSVLECSSPLELFAGTDDTRKRRRAGALQDAVACYRTHSSLMS